MVSWRHECTGHTQPGIPELPVSGLALPGEGGETNRMFVCVYMCDFVCLYVCVHGGGGEGQRGH